MIQAMLSAWCSVIASESLSLRASCPGLYASPLVDAMAPPALLRRESLPCVRHGRSPQWRLAAALLAEFQGGPCQHVGQQVVETLTSTLRGMVWTEPAPREGSGQQRGVQLGDRWTG